jgi:hypothetical protein
MTTNRLAKPEGSTPKQCPPDMPRGDSEAERAARQKFWIERGNAQLAEAGKGYLEWKAKDGHYWIEPR